MKSFLISEMLNRVSILFLLVLIPMVSLAQQQKKEKNRYKPEKPSETIVAAWTPVQVDNYIGLRGGYGMGIQRFEPNKPSATQTGIYNFGLVYRFDVPKQKYVGCVEIDLEYLQKAFGYETYAESGIIYSRKYSTIMLPILWQPYLPLGKRGSRFYLDLGPYVSYTLSSGSTYKLYKKESGETIEEGTYEYDALRDNKWEYGCPLGAGFVIAIGKDLRLGIDFRYNICLSDIMKGVNKYPTNPFRSPVDQMNLSFGINYRIPARIKKSKEKEEETEK